MSKQSANPRRAALFTGPEVAAYGFGHGHPFGPDRHDVFVAEVQRLGLDRRVLQGQLAQATREDLERFHEPRYLDFVIDACSKGTGYLDEGDTPAMPGIYEAACWVAGSVIKAAEGILRGDYPHAFLPIAGLHHAGRGHASGFCIINDIGVVIEWLKDRHGLRQIAYVDIDAHHGDGVFYGFEDDPAVIFADIHEDGRFLFPGTGRDSETGSGSAVGTKLNIPLEPGAGDERFHMVWPQIEVFLRQHPPEFILFQCGADSLEGDPITHLRYSAAAHAHAAKRLVALAAEFCDGRLLALGGGGYSRPNLARAWTGVLAALVAEDEAGEVSAASTAT